MQTGYSQKEIPVARFFVPGYFVVFELLELLFFELEDDEEELLLELVFAQIGGLLKSV